VAVHRARRRVSPPLARHWSGLAVIVLALGLVTSAFLAPGLRVADLRLQDGTIFGINQSAGLLGTVNTQIKDLSGAVAVADQSFSLLQEGRTVVVKGETSNQIQSFDPASGQLGVATNLPAGGDLVLNAGNIAVISRLNGSVWFGDAASMLQRDFNKEKALLDLGENALATVTTSGSLIGLSLVDSQIVRYVNGSKTMSRVPMQLDASVANVQLSAVGDKAVVLDRTKQLIWFEGSDKPINMPMGSRDQLAQPVPALALGGGNLGAVVATPTGIVGVARKALVSLSGTMPEGAVQAPVSANGCVYGVVGSKVSTSCPGVAPVVTDVPGLGRSPQLALRVNGASVILNDARSGDIWLVTDGMRRISDWSKVSPASASAKTDTPSNEATKVNPDRSGANRPPVAADDALTVRAGRSSILTVLDNDSDPDGDLLSVVDAPAPVDGVTFQLVRGGAGLQAVVASDAKGTRSFTYRITDGRGGFSQPAHVTLTIESGDQTVANQPPALFSKEAVVVAAGQQTRIRELLRWRDPDGDDLVLTDAKLVDGPDEVSFTSDGTITFTDVGKVLGLMSVRVTVFDGQEYATSLLLLDVRRPQEVTPVANGDFATAMANQEIEVSPLDNDQGVNLALASVDTPTPKPTKLTVDYTAKKLRFKASVAGTYYVGYTVTNGRTSFGLIRIDVVDRAAENRPPVTTRAVVLLTHGGSVTVDPLLNDEDPDGDVLVVQSVTSSGLNVTMRDRHLMTISEVTARNTPVTITYYVSDGYHAAVPGTIVVIPSNPVGEVRPIAVADDANVRVGDAVTVSPLDNDFSPVGLDLTLEPTLYDNSGGAWVDGSMVRFVAPAVPGRVTATYKVKDSLGRTATSEVRFNVISPDIANQAPVPSLVTGRVVSGTTQRVAIPLQDIDPNGDSVRLVGLGSGPKLGRILSVGPTYLEYQAFPKTAGTDTFTYVVVDTYGAKATGDIRVGVVPASVGNTEPTANQDVVVTRPGRTVTLQPLANDSDPDGDKVSLADTGAVSFPTLQAQVVDTSAIQVVVPDRAGTWFGTYRIRDARGAIATGNIVVTADPKAELLAPKAFDDLVDAREVFQRDTVDVPVLANDYDPDGLRTDLALSVPASDAAGPPAVVVSTPGGPQLRVPIGDRLRVFRYTVTDVDGLSASAFVTVPGKSDATPWLRDPGVELTVTAGQLLTIPVNQYVSGTQGRQVIISSADKVSGAPGIGRRDSAADLTYQPGDSDAGAAAITFEVVEDVDASVTDPRSATLTIRINVLPRAAAKTTNGGGQTSPDLNQPPYAPSPIEVKAGQGEAPTEQNLQAFLVDPEGDAIIVGGLESQLPPGLSVTMQGSAIFASASVGTKKGTSGIVRVRVSDVRGAQSLVSVTVTAVPTTRPLTVTVDDPLDATQGLPSQVDVTANDKSSLDDPALTVVNAAIEQGSGTVAFTPTSVTVIPDSAFEGAMTVRYTVRDATGDPDRDVDGRIVATVRGKPGAPGTPRNVAIGDESLTATWTSVLDTGGLPVTGYWLTATGSDGQVERVFCPTTTCTVSRLHNTVQYTLTVTAQNSVGEGPASPVSAPMVPDVVPDQMAAPSVQRQSGRSGGSLMIAWAPPTNRGSAISSYTVTMKTAGGQSRSVPAPATSLVWDNLTNGTDYSFTLQATNASGTSVESPIGTGRPSAPPDAPSVTAIDGNDPGGGSVLGQWRAPASNGEPITAYLLNISTNPGSFTVDGPADLTVGADSSPDGSFSRLFTGLTNGLTYYVAVRAVSLAGSSDVGRSGPVVPYGAPTVTVAPTAVAGDRSATVSMGATASPPGATIVAWVVSGYDNAGETVSNKVATASADGGFSLTITWSYPNVYGHTWQFTAVPRVQNSAGQVKEGRPSPPSDPVQPKGPPGQPDVTIIGPQGVTGSSVDLLFHATPGDANGNPPAMTLTYSSPWGSGTANGADQFVLTVPMTASGSVSVTQTASDGSSSNRSLVVQPAVSVDPATAVMTVRYASEKPLFCETLSGTTVLDGGRGIEVADNAPGYYTYQWAYDTVPVGTGIMLQCGGNASSPTTYQISTTR
jgi:large repetitive protein